jgi:riboflavin kinase/FMN adenylyltransferase
MQVHRDIDQLPVFNNAVVTIGTFDGVHLGHQKIIAELKRQAKLVNGESVIVSFHPHPRKVVMPHQNLQLINSLEEKIYLLSKTGIDHLVIVPFTAGFSELSADDYIEHFLVKKFQPATICIGYDHHFGQGRTGNYQLLEEQATRFGYKLVEIPVHVLNEITVSSTKIRKALLAGDITVANSLLGYQFFFEGKVVQGDQLGRTLGYPTANLVYTDPDKIHLGHGVYAVYAEINGEQNKGMMSIGTRPTLEKSEEKVEVNLFDFDDTIYGETVTVTVAHFLRQQEKYSSLELMVEQLHRDRAQSLQLL